MTPPVPTSEPDILYAGDTWAWTKTLSNYPPSDGWTLGYAIRGQSVLANNKVAVTVVGPTYSVKVLPADTTPLLAGAYQWQSFVDGSGAHAGEHYTVQAGVFTVLPSMSAIADSSAVTHAERTLALIEAKIEGRITSDHESYSIAGRSIMKIPTKELIRLRAIYQSKVFRLRNPGQLGPLVLAQMNNADGTIGTGEPVVLPVWYRSFNG